MRKDIFNLFLNKEVPDDIFEGYLRDDEDCYLKLQDFIGENMKKEMLSWSTTIGILEASEHLYKCAVENGNIKPDKDA